MKQQLITTLLALCITFPLNIFPQSNLPSKKERIYSLSMIWKELEYNFAFPSYFQKHRLDSLYLNYLPKIENVKDEYEYYRILSSFMANMNEAHTRIIPPQKLPYDMPPIITSNIGEHIYVKNIDKKLAEINTYKKRNNRSKWNTSNGFSKRFGLPIYRCIHCALEIRQSCN